MKLILLFTWFLCGLYALKAGEEKLGKRHGALKEYYNLLAVFLGPVAIAYCYLRGDAWNFIIGLFKAKQKDKAKPEIPVVIVDAKGNRLSDSADVHDFPETVDL